MRVGFGPRARHGCLPCCRRSASVRLCPPELGAFKLGLKQKTFSEIRSGPHSGGPWTDAVSVGERQRLLAALRSRPTSQLHKCRKKIVKFQHHPSATGLFRQLLQVTSELLRTRGRPRSAIGLPWLRAQPRQMGGEWNTAPRCGHRGVLRVHRSFFSVTARQV